MGRGSPSQHEALAKKGAEIAAASAPNRNLQTIETEPTMSMTNNQLRVWFSRGSIPIEELSQMWIQLDRNEETKKEIQSLLLDLDTNHKELEVRLRHRIEFGTAGPSKFIVRLKIGLRGQMQAGFSRMNNLTVIQASQVNPLKSKHHTNKRD
jgi:hypothetical protein